MVQYVPMERDEKHIDVFKKLLDVRNKEVTFSEHAKVVRIQNADGKSLVGVLLDKSIAIPLSANAESHANLKKYGSN